MPSAVVDAMNDLLGPEHVVTDPAARPEYGFRWSPHATGDPGVIVRPAGSTEVQAVLATANASGWTVATRGGGVAMTGATPTPRPPTITLDTTRLDRLVAVDIEHMAVTAEAGITMDALERAAAAHGCVVPTVVVPARYVTLGGVLSGVVGGGLPMGGAVLGTLQDHLLALTVVLADGTVVRTAGTPDSSGPATDLLRGACGPDLAGLFVGDAGTFGVKVEATLRMFPAPACTGGGAWLFPSVDAAWLALEAISARSEPPYTDLYLRDGPDPVLLLAADGPTRAVVMAKIAAVDAACSTVGGRPAPEDIAATAEGRARGDALRVDDYVRRPTAIVAYLCPRAGFASLHRLLAERLDRALRVGGLGERGVRHSVGVRPHLRTAIYEVVSLDYDPGAGIDDEVAELAIDCYRLVADCGGWPEPHQGLASIAIAERWPEGYGRTMGALKAALDPNRVLNPGAWGL